MLIIKEKSIANAWTKSCLNLYNDKSESQEKKLYRHSPAVICVNDPYGNMNDSRFPISQKNIKIINNYLITGKNENEVVHDWTKIYRKRLFGNEYNQIEHIIEYLKNKPSGKRAQASIWNQKQDLYGEIGPCLQVIWLQIINNKLEMHIHMRATDCYGKLLMNMNEFVTLQNYISDKIGIKSGQYIQFIDSLHFNTSDKAQVDELIKKIKTAN